MPEVRLAFHPVSFVTVEATCPACGRRCWFQGQHDEREPLEMLCSCGNRFAPGGAEPR